MVINNMRIMRCVAAVIMAFAIITAMQPQNVRAERDPYDTFRQLRREGIKAEEKMYKATGGVNIHKGAIFLMGIVCGAVGRLWKPAGKQCCFEKRDAAKTAAEQAGALITKNAGKETLDIEAIEELDKVFVEKNLSPGGCADLLAITYFLYDMTEAPDIDTMMLTATIPAL